jgi:hypothetical protein
LSRYLELSNYIKTNCSKRWLTNSQIEVWNLLSDLLKSQTFINLYGASGSGKTFLGWLFHKEGIVEYIPHISCLREYSRIVNTVYMIDNVLEERNEFRKVLKESQLLGIPKVIAISRYPIDDQIPSIQLCCTDEDIRKAAENLKGFDSIPNLDEIINFWQLFRATITR